MSDGASNVLSWIEDELDALDQANLRRRLRMRLGAQQATLEIDGRRLVNFASNDYLGLAADERVAAAAARAAEREGWGGGASPLITGRSELHDELERRLAEFEGTQSALLFSSGYAANMGAICSLVGPGDAIYSDALNHASIVDGCRLSRATVQVYPHGDWHALEALLQQGQEHRRRMIVTDSLFSMDGDLAPLLELAELADRYAAMLMVDEAHATGIFGRLGRGVSEHLGVEERVHVRVGTLSKALGCAGGFVCGSRLLVEWLVNRARPYVFSTAHPAAGCAAALAALGIVHKEPERRQRLLERAAHLRDRLRAQGWQLSGSASQIIPIVVGDAARALAAAAQLEGAGMLVPAIRPPTVPRGQSRLRVSLSYAHTGEMIDRLVQSLGALAMCHPQNPTT